PDWITIHSPGPTFPAGRPFLHLDRMAFSNDIELLHSTVIGDPRAAIASDHRPVSARFRISHQTQAKDARGASDP
ncbi:MAG: hypothetical protein L0H65_18395, partial [Pseudorhodobacter sp.]|nr:hypothetical protein [Pseudorhodobacter sp.]